MPREKEYRVSLVGITFLSEKNSPLRFFFVWKTKKRLQQKKGKDKNEEDEIFFSFRNK